MKKTESKKKTTKLNLHRETLRRLDGDKLAEVVGGTLGSHGCTNNCTGNNCQVH